MADWWEDPGFVKDVASVDNEPVPSGGNDDPLPNVFDWERNIGLRGNAPPSAPPDNGDPLPNVFDWEREPNLRGPSTFVPPEYSQMQPEYVPPGAQDRFNFKAGGLEIPSDFPVIGGLLQKVTSPEIAGEPDPWKRVARLLREAPLAGFFVNPESYAAPKPEELAQTFKPYMPGRGVEIAGQKIPFETPILGGLLEATMGPDVITEENPALRVGKGLFNVMGQTWQSIAQPLAGYVSAGLSEIPNIVGRATGEPNVPEFGAEAQRQLEVAKKLVGTTQAGLGQAGEVGRALLAQQSPVVQFALPMLFDPLTYFGGVGEGAQKATLGRLANKPLAEYSALDRILSTFNALGKARIPKVGEGQIATAEQLGLKPGSRVNPFEYTGKTRAVDLVDTSVNQVMGRSRDLNAEQYAQLVEHLKQAALTNKIPEALKRDFPDLARQFQSLEGQKAIRALSDIDAAQLQKTLAAQKAVTAVYATAQELPKNTPEALKIAWGSLKNEDGFLRQAIARGDKIDVAQVFDDAAKAQMIVDTTKRMGDYARSAFKLTDADNIAIRIKDSIKAFEANLFIGTNPAVLVQNWLNNKVMTGVRGMPLTARAKGGNWAGSFVGGNQYVVDMWKRWGYNYAPDIAKAVLGNKVGGSSLTGAGGRGFGLLGAYEKIENSQRLSNVMYGTVQAYKESMGQVAKTLYNEKELVGALRRINPRLPQIVEGMVASGATKADVINMFRQAGLMLTTEAYFDDLARAMNMNPATVRTLMTQSGVLNDLNGALRKAKNADEFANNVRLIIGRVTNQVKQARDDVAKVEARMTPAAAPVAAPITAPVRTLDEVNSRISALFKESTIAKPKRQAEIVDELEQLTRQRDELLPREVPATATREVAQPIVVDVAVTLPDGQVIEKKGLVYEPTTERPKAIGAEPTKPIAIEQPAVQLGVRVETGANAPGVPSVAPLERAEVTGTSYEAARNLPGYDDLKHVAGLSDADILAMPESDRALVLKGIEARRADLGNYFHPSEVLESGVGAGVAPLPEPRIAALSTADKLTELEGIRKELEAFDAQHYRGGWANSLSSTAGHPIKHPTDLAPEELDRAIQRYGQLLSDRKSFGVETSKAVEEAIGPMTAERAAKFTSPFPTEAAKPVQQALINEADQLGKQVESARIATYATKGGTPEFEKANNAYIAAVKAHEDKLRQLADEMGVAAKPVAPEVAAPAGFKVGDYVQFKQGGGQYYIEGETANRFELIDTAGRKQSVMKDTSLIRVEAASAAPKEAMAKGTKEFKQGYKNGLESGTPIPGVARSPAEFEAENIQKAAKAISEGQPTDKSYQYWDGWLKAVGEKNPEVLRAYPDLTAKYAAPAQPAAEAASAATYAGVEGIPTKVQPFHKPNGDWALIDENGVAYGTSKKTYAEAVTMANKENARMAGKPLAPQIAQVERGTLEPMAARAIKKMETEQQAARSRLITKQEQESAQRAAGIIPRPSEVGSFSKQPNAADLAMAKKQPFDKLTPEAQRNIIELPENSAAREAYAYLEMQKGKYGFSTGYTPTQERYIADQIAKGADIIQIPADGTMRVRDPIHVRMVVDGYMTPQGNVAKPERIAENLVKRYGSADKAFEQLDSLNTQALNIAEKSITEKTVATTGELYTDELTLFSKVQASLRELTPSGTSPFAEKITGDGYRIVTPQGEELARFEGSGAKAKADKWLAENRPTETPGAGTFADVIQSLRNATQPRDGAQLFAPDELLASRYGVLADFLEKALPQIRNDYDVLRGATLDLPTRNLLNGWLSREVYPGMNDARVAAGRMGRWAEQRSVLNYNARTNMDDWLSWLIPFGYWPRATATNLAMEFLNRPALLANYIRARQALDEIQNEQGFPARFKGKIKVPMPFASFAPWLEDGVYWDPLRDLIPIDRFLTMPTQAAQYLGATYDEDIAKAIRQMAANGEITADQAELAIRNKDDLWKRVAEDTKARSQPDPMDIANLFTSMHFPLDWAHKMLTGRPEDIGYLIPANRLVKGGSALLKEAFPHLPLPLGGIDIEGALRDRLGVPKGDPYEVYHIDRMLASMAGDGTITERQAKQALLERSGLVFEAAKQRAAVEAGIAPVASLTGAYSARGMAYGETKQAENKRDLANVVAGEVTRLGYDPKKLSSTEQWDILKKFKATSTGSAIQKWYDTHPEYTVRSALFQQEEQRLQNWLTDEFWTKYMGMSSLARRDFRQQQDDPELDKFIDKETRDYKTVPLLALEKWTIALRGYVPKVTQTNQEPSVAQLQQTIKPYLPTFTKAEQKAYTEYTAWQDKVRDFSAEYAALTDNTAKKQYRDTHPDLVAYWDWREKFRVDFPRVAEVIWGKTTATTQPAATTGGVRAGGTSFSGGGGSRSSGFVPYGYSTSTYASSAWEGVRAELAGQPDVLGQLEGYLVQPTSARAAYLVNYPKLKAWLSGKSDAYISSLLASYQQYTKRFTPYKTYKVSGGFARA